MRPILLEMGFDVALHDNPVLKAPPLLLASRVENPELPTILIYGHGRCHPWPGQPMEPPGSARFATVTLDGMMYGRGTADNKGQHLINFLALKTLIDAARITGV